MIVMGPSHPDLVAVTDELGQFRLANLLPGEYRLRAVAAHNRPGTAVVTLAPGERAHVRLYLGGLIEERIDELPGDLESPSSPPHENGGEGIDELPGDNGSGEPEQPIPEERSRRRRSR